MPWLRSGDNAATHPIVMRVVSLVRAAIAFMVDERDVAVNEVFGFVTRCALQSAGHTTDYVIDEGTAFMLGGNRTERLLELATKAGYLTRTRAKGITSYLLVNDPDFIHMRTKEEIERERQRKADNSNAGITVPVRLRDGDECRYCGVIVNWRDRKGGRGGTYDHRIPGQAATVDTLVVACNACNAGRGNDPNADTRYPLRPVPADPYYSPVSVGFLADHGHIVAVTEDQRPGSQPGHARRDPAASGSTRTPPTGPAPVVQPRQPSNHRRDGPPGSADNQHPGSGFAGTGRDGSGGSARSSPTSNAARRRKRSPRGRGQRDGGSA